MEMLGRLAVVGDSVEVPGATIRVTAVDRRRIAEIRVVLHEEPGADAAEGGTRA